MSHVSCLTSHLEFQVRVSTHTKITTKPHARFGVLSGLPPVYIAFPCASLPPWASPQAVFSISGEERAIAVGNSQEGLVKWIESQGDRDSPRLLRTKAGHAAGILEGLKEMGFAL